MATQSPKVLQPHPLPLVSRAEIDTSAPFESVKEAANLFGGMGFCRKPISPRGVYSSQNAHQQHSGDGEILGIVEVEEQAAQLERDLSMKERETREVLKELETAKSIVEELKLKLQGTLKENPYDNKENLVAHAQLPEEGKLESDKAVHTNGASAPGFILQELKQAKLNLTRTTNDLADIRATVDLYNKKIEKQRKSLEKTRQRLSLNASKVPCPEEELNQTKQKQEGLTETNVQGSGHDPMNITRELRELSSQTEQFKQVGEAAKSQVSRAISEIEQTKTRIRNAEMRLVAAKRMREAAKASEAVALAEIEALSKSENKGAAASQKNLEDVTLSFEEYSPLVPKAQEAEKACPGRVDTMPPQVDEVNVSKTEFLKRVAEATEEVKSSKKALEEALSRVEAATRGKLEVEDALRVWRSNHGRKRRSSHNSTRSKSCHPCACNRVSLVEASGLNLGNDELKPVLKPSLSIGQILSRKLLLAEEYGNGLGTENKIMDKHKVSLGQMLRRRSAELHSDKVSGKDNSAIPAKRKKFSLGRIPLLAAQQSNKKKNITKSPVCGMAAHKLEFL